jgi:hypothetical protein
MNVDVELSSSLTERELHVKAPPFIEARVKLNAKVSVKFARRLPRGRGVEVEAEQSCVGMLTLR